jgi:valine--pyruvate aminotransferase
VQLSSRGRKMSALTGVRQILEDAAEGSRARGIPFANLSTGNPAALPEVVEAWRSLYGEVLSWGFDEYSGRYGPARGSDQLVGAIVDYFNDKYAWRIREDNVLVSPGAQFLAFMATAVFTGHSSTGFNRLLIPVVPDYTGYQGLSLDEDGIVGVTPGVAPAGERRFEYVPDLDEVRAQPDIGMILCSNPSNPTGKTLQDPELRALAGVAAHRDIPLVVDNAYGAPFPMVASTETPPLLHSNTINLFTLSKAGLPGERLGFAVGPATFIATMTSFMANTALHAPRLTQEVAARALETRMIDDLSQRVINPFYRARQQMAVALFEKHLPFEVDWSIHQCDGGLFSWVVVDDERLDADKVYDALKKLGIYVVPGRHFFPERVAGGGVSRANCLRISLSPDEDLLELGVDALGEVLRKELL